MPVEIVNGYACKLCSGQDIEVKEHIKYNWVDNNSILREKIIDYKCGNCEVIIIRIIKHKEEHYH